MGIVEILGVAGSLSLLAGWRLYLTILATGIAMHFGWLPLPEHLQGLQILANPWVLGVAAIGTVAEFLADKVAWVDSIWDGVHSFVRPLGGALIALALVDSSDPAWQVIAFLLGGGALLSHGAKATTRAVVNISPEPASNVVVSTGEDVATTGLIALAIAYPPVAIVIALLLLVAAVVVIIALRRLLRNIRAGLKKALGDTPEEQRLPPAS